jgi:protein-S-isoprenylcysteine O-methyltransferase Ste14
MAQRKSLELKIVLGVLMVLGAYFGAGGSLGLWPGWCFGALLTFSLVRSYLIGREVAPDLQEDRVSWGAGTKRWDQPIVSCLMFAPIVTPLVAGLDARSNGISPSFLLVALGAVFMLVGSDLTHRAMAVNRFYSPVVRIQKDRGHTVVESGPYGTIRHPGNLGNLLFFAGSPLVLSSRWAWIPAGFCIVLIVMRTVLEDRALSDELPGYLAFAQRTRSRLIPGLW